MCDCGSNGSETKAITHSKENTQIDPSMLLIRFHVNFELVIHNRSDIIWLASRGKQIRGEDGECLGIVQVQTPITNRGNNVDHENITNKYIGNGKEGADERAEQERWDCWPVQGECAEAQAMQARSKLLCCDGLGEHPAEPWNAGDGREQVPWNSIPCEAAGECNDKKLGSCHTAFFFFMQRPADPKLYSYIELLANIMQHNLLLKRVERTKFSTTKREQGFIKLTVYQTKMQILFQITWL